MYALIKILSEGYMNLLEARDVLEKRGQKLLEELYGKSGVDDNLKRYEAVLNGFLKEFGEKDVKMFSSPGTIFPSIIIPPPTPVPRVTITESC